MTKLGYVIICIIASCGLASGDGLKTSLNSNIGAVPFVCDADATTMKRWRRENAMIGMYDPMICFVI